MTKPSGILGLIRTVAMIAVVSFMLLIPLIFFVGVGLLAYCFAAGFWKHHNNTCKLYMDPSEPESEANQS